MRPWLIMVRWRGANGKEWGGSTIPTFWKQLSWEGLKKVIKLMSLQLNFFSANLHNWIKPLHPALSHPLPKMLLRWYRLICHSHATVASNGSTMVMVFLILDEGVSPSNCTIPTPVMVRYHLAISTNIVKIKCYIYCSHLYFPEEDHPKWLSIREIWVQTSNYISWCGQQKWEHICNLQSMHNLQMLCQCGQCQGNGTMFHQFLCLLELWG